MNVIEKAKLLSDESIDISYDCCIVRTGKAYGIVTSNGLINENYIDYNLVTDRILIMTTENNKQHLYLWNNFVKEFDMNSNTFGVELASAIKELIRDDVRYLDIQPYGIFSSVRVTKRKLANSFIAIIITVYAKAFYIMYNNEGDELCSFESGYNSKFSVYTEDNVILRNEKLLPAEIDKLKEIGKFNSSMMEEVQAKFGANNHMLLNRNGKVIIASENMDLRSIDKIMADNKVWNIKGDSVELNIDCKDFDADDMIPLKGNSIFMHKHGESSGTFVDLSNQKFWRNCEIGSYDSDSEYGVDAIFIIEDTRVVMFDTSDKSYTYLKKIEDTKNIPDIVEVQSSKGKTFKIKWRMIQYFKANNGECSWIYKKS